MTNNKHISKKQKIVLTGYTGDLWCALEDFHEDVENRLGQPVMSHRFGDKEFFEEKIKPLYKEDMEHMIGQNIPEKI